MKSPIILALDTPQLDVARRWVDCTQESIGAYKLGLEFFLTHGSEGVKQIQAVSDVDIFLDLKLHDIPNTVGKAALQVASLSPKFLTVHAAGGQAMIKSAVISCPDVAITAVTVLTSLSENDVQEIGFKGNSLESAVDLARLAVQAGAKAIVCSPLEISAISEVIPQHVRIITPGVRPSDETLNDDQNRVMTPKQAIDRGAHYVVIGRPITRFWETGADAMRNRARTLVEELS